MSLQVWLPLNGNVNNQGLSDVTVNGGKIFTATGKLSSTAYNDTQVINIPIASLSGSRTWSFCFWGYVVSSAITTNWTKIASIIDGNSDLRIEVCPQGNYSNDIYCYSIHNNGGYVITSGAMASPNGSQYYNNWTHFCITSDGTTITKYLNGVFIGTIPYDGDGVITGTFTLNNSDKIYKQDVRIYDHCLSPKEVAEIAKGLCLHYPLNNIYNCQSNKYSSPYCDGYMSYIGGFTRTALTDERGYNYKMTYTGTGNNSWKSLRVPTYSFTVGKTYYYSVKIRCNKWTADTLYLRASRSENDWATRYIAVCSTSLADGKWHEYYTYQTVNETYDRSGTTVTSNPVLEFYTGACVTDGFVYDFDFDIKDVQVVESNEYVPFQQGEWNTNVISDCSGFGNDGIKTGSINWSRDTSRYSGSYEFNGTDTSIKNNSDTWHGGTINDKTISCWIKPSGSACGGAGGIMAESASGTIMSMYNSVWQFANGSSWVNYNNGGITVGEWSHHACTIKDGVIKIYKNGSLISTNTNTSILTTLSSSNYVAVGCDFPGGDEYFNGLISDFRIYSTALSDSDILELYNTPINIDNKGNLYAYEFIEEDKNNFSKQGMVKNSEFIDFDTAGDSYTNASISSTVDYANIFIEK